MRYFGFICLILLLAVVPVLAQQTCPVLVQDALQALGDNCANLDRNTACYGYNHLEATFNEPVEDNFFTQVTERAGLTQMETLETSPLDTTSGEWGIGVMNVQANVPNTLPGQAVTFLLLGDAQVENDVEPDEAFQPVAPVDVTTSGIANLRATPDFNAPTLLTLPDATTLSADGRSEDGAFLRVVYQEQVLWVDAAVITGPEALNELPILRDDSFTPMQAFYFTTGIGEPACSESPSLVAINSPENLHINLTVNGAAITVGSLITFQTTEDGAVMTVIEGGVRNEDGLLIPAGQASDLELDEDNNIVDWSNPRPITTEEFTAGQVVQQAIFNLENPNTIATSGTCNPGQTTTHTVAAGENLFRIAIRYNSTVADIAALNNIADVRTIFVGQVLQIPCGSNTSGQSPMEGITQPPIINPIGLTPIPGTNVCSAFRQTSPLGGYPNGATPFYWDGVATATSYTVLVYNEQGALVGTFATQGNQTTVTGDMSPNTVGQGTNFTWMVQAVANGQVICSTQGLTLPRDQFPQGGGSSGQGPTLFLTCPGSTSLIINWSNVNPGSLISWNITSPFPASGNTTSAGTSGTQFITTPSPTQTYSGTASSSNPASTQPVSVFCP
jgi:LysM repeat protein